jgi:Na+/proline symporter
LGRYPGLTGLFIAGILSASLSAISSGINSIATVILEDIYKRIIVDHSMSDKKQAIISKILCKFIYWKMFIIVI